MIDDGHAHGNEIERMRARFVSLAMPLPEDKVSVIEKIFLVSCLDQLAPMIEFVHLSTLLEDKDPSGACTSC